MSKALNLIRESLGHVPNKWRPSEWLDTKIPELNLVLGHPTRGIPYGRITEMSGWESQGKTALSLTFAALAQHDGARVVWGDVENSFDARWARLRGFLPCVCKGEDHSCKHCGGEDSATFGLDNDKLILIQPYVGKFTKLDKKTKKRVQEKEARLSNAQELCGELEQAMCLGGATKSVLVLDSIAALLTSGESDAGIEDQNMRTSLDLPLFMGKLLRRWVGLGQVHNTWITLINQLREGPSKGGFGDPTYSPGGNAPLFYSHTRVRVARVFGSKIIDKGKIIGIKGVMKALKNKSGGEEGAEVGYKIMFRGPVQFVPAKEVKKKEE